MGIPQNLIVGTLNHLEKGVPIKDLGLKASQRERLARVEHVYWQWMKNPMLEPFELFKQMLRGKGSDAASEWRTAQRDKLLFDFVIEHIAPPSRRISEARVRAAGNHLMQMGMDTDNGRDIEAGAKLIMKLDKLDQPESEQNDMSKLAFLPSVVVTDIREVDDTKENYDDDVTKSIMQKYGGYVDDKRTMVEERVAAMEARSGRQEDN